MTSSTDEPEPILVPAENASWDEIWTFALSYNGYERSGSLDAAADIARANSERWHRDRNMTDDLATARTALFFEQRSHRWAGGDRPDDWEEHAGPYIRALVARIHELSGGTVAGPSDWDGPPICTGE